MGFGVGLETGEVPTVAEVAPDHALAVERGGRVEGHGPGVGGREIEVDEAGELFVKRNEDGLKVSGPLGERELSQGRLPGGGLDPPAVHLDVRFDPFGQALGRTGLKLIFVGEFFLRTHDEVAREDRDRENAEPEERERQSS